MRRLIALVNSLAATLYAHGQPVATPAGDAAGKAWWAHVHTLAGGAMEGRRTGSEGYPRAAKSVVSQFDAMGFKPVGCDGCISPSTSMSRASSPPSLPWLCPPRRQYPTRPHYLESSFFHRFEK